MENPFINMEKGKGIRLAEFIIEQEIDVFYTKKPFEHKGPEYVFSNAEEVYLWPCARGGILQGMRLWKYYLNMEGSQKAGLISDCHYKSY
jgi:hypothetical protein